MKKMIASLMLIGLVSTLSAATSISTSVVPNRVVSLLTSNNATINQISIQNTSAVALATVVFYDAPFTNLVFSYSAYSNTVYVRTNYPYIYTNFFGAVTTNYWSNIVYGLTQSNPAATNYFASVWSATINSNTTATYAPPGGQFVSRGLAMTNTAGVVAIVTLTQ